MWALGTRPYKGSHFSTFPPELPELCIRASTGPRCCSECGAAWVPVISPPEPPVHPALATHWPTCQCVNAEAGLSLYRPCRVLDPFIGSGTTAVAATKLGRDCVGIDAGEEYIKMAKERLGDSGG